MALKPAMSSIRCFAVAIFAVLSLLSLLSIALQSNAQTVKRLEEQHPVLIRKTEFRHFDVNDGLSSLFCRGKIIVDRFGCLWIGTIDGLNKYNGYKFEVLRNNPQVHSSLFTNAIKQILECRDGSIWIGTSSEKGLGLHEYDANEHSFVRHSSSLVDSTVQGWTGIITTMLEDRVGNIWVGTSRGLYQVRRDLTDSEPYSRAGQRLTFTRYFRDPKKSGSLSNNVVVSVREDSNGSLWIRSKDGVDRFEPETRSFTHFKDDPRVPQSLVGKQIQEIYEDRAGSVWIGTTEGLYRFEKQNGVLTHFKNIIGAERGFTDEVETIFEDMSGTLWVGTDDGLHEINSMTGKIVRHSEISKVMSIVEDRAGNLWVGTNGNGVKQLTKRARQFRTITHVATKDTLIALDQLEVTTNDVWIGQEKYFLRLDTSLNVRSYNLSSYLRHEEAIGRVRDDGKGRLWFGTRGSRLGEFDKRTGAIHFHEYSQKGSVPKTFNVQGLCFDKAGDLWLATSDVGLLRFNPKSRSFTNYRPAPNDSKTISSTNVWSIIEDEEGYLWVGTFPGGLNKFNRSMEKFTRYTHSTDDSVSLLVKQMDVLLDGQDGTLWVGTNLGLHRLNKRTGKVSTYSRGEELSSWVYQIVKDDNQNLWLGYMNNGISRFHIPTETFTTFGRRDGLSDEKFNTRCYFRTSNGEIVMGSNSGFVVFNPDSFRPSTFIPPIILTGFSLFDKPMHLLQTGDSYIPITMPYDSNFFAFQFVALDFTVPERNQHAYKLEGFEDTWNFVGNKREARYTKVPPGHYVFRVKGSNSDGVWNEKGTFITITITPPWWKTMWAYFGYGFTIVGVLYFIRRTEKKRDRMKQQEEIERVETEKRLQQEFSKQLIETQEAERKRVASELHDSLGQHLLIVNNELQLCKQSKERKDEDIDRTITTVKGAIKEVREIASNLHPHHLEKLGLRAAVEAMIEQVSRSTPVKFDAAIEDVNDKLSMEAKINLYRVLQEAIANIVRHSGATKANITISQVDNDVQAIIEDDGKGFVQGSSRGRRQGFGLKSMTERMKFVGGIITFDSSPGKGTAIKITIPIHS